MTDKLPPNLLALFAPRPPLRYLPPSDLPPEERRTAKLDGAADYIQLLKEKSENAKASKQGAIPADDPRYEPPPTESWLERHDRLEYEKADAQTHLVTEGWKEAYQPDATYSQSEKGNPFTALFVARLGYSVTEEDLRREFGRFGRITQVRIVRDGGQGDSKLGKKKSRKGTSRGYGFVVFESENDMKGLCSTTHMTMSC